MGNGMMSGIVMPAPEFGQLIPLLITTLLIVANTMILADNFICMSLVEHTFRQTGLGFASH